MGQTLVGELSPFEGRTKLKQQQPTKDRTKRMHERYHSCSVLSNTDVRLTRAARSIDLMRLLRISIRNNCRMQDGVRPPAAAATTSCNARYPQLRDRSYRNLPWRFPFDINTSF
jgi:hypothetical protein